MTEPDRISKRQSSGKFFYVRRVPKGLSDLDPRGVIRQSLKTTDATEAAIKARQLDDALEALWAGLLAGKNATTSWQRYESAVKLASLRGFSYRSAADLAAGDLDDLMPRIADARQAMNQPKVVEAVLGGAPPAEIKLSGLYAAYFEQNKVALMGKSPGQMKRHKGQRDTSVQVAIDILGDLPLAQVTKSDTHRYRQHWVDRVANGEVTSASANRTMSDIKGMMTVVDTGFKTAYGEPWENLRIKDKKQKSKARKRPPYPDEFIRDRLLKPGALDGMNLEARCLTYLMVETGVRPSEGCNLRPEDIRLNAKIPHIVVAERDDREQKSAQSVRTIPLVGVALWALQQCPNGFARYHDKGDGLSSVINKFLRENDLKPSAKHVLYSIRHSFQDRLIAAGAQDRMQVDLMGHELGRPDYGAGNSLEQKWELLQRMAFAWAPTGAAE